ncbi:hypothetical protein NitYY0826_C1070 [Nitratiruptor sp. YY08-26]|uniref:hypothetical protein n=1 Tax=unclassified Nitratiruptor TaxID=2624044 RepID=UPI0019150F3F|nr:MULTISPECIES: hypothetical protein [unclassified Nitratiruptor]BCD62197.1 hypothetical protein NitYY0813_C1068 [Nitratiruptor sp. YY08-13]BCD66133.1 hypothetical protein NitYY0826_C1070 [Nitratiruptor sp. YY08-26]
MKKIVITLATLGFLALQIYLTYYTRSAWIILGSLLLMAYFIITNFKELALAIVLAIFGYGGVLATMKHQQYISNNITVKNNIVYDAQSGKKFQILYEAYHTNEKKGTANKILVCEQYILFHKLTKDKFCYLREGSKLYRIEEKA